MYKNKIISKIYSHGRGWVFTQKDFAHLVPRGSIDMQLSALCRDGTIRRIRRGLYDYPVYSEMLQMPVSPDIHQVAQAIARQKGWEIQADEVTALHVLGLSSQVPAQYRYLTDGKATKVEIGKRVISFSHTNHHKIKIKHQPTALLVQAIKGLGKDGVDEAMIERMRQVIDEKDRAKLVTHGKGVESWILVILKRVSQDG